MPQEQAPNTTGTWTTTQAYVLGIICLIVGLPIGYLLRGSASQAVPVAQTQAVTQAAPVGMPPGMSAMQQPSPDQMRHMAETEAEPLLQELKQKPNDPQILYQIGNIFYDTKLFPEAIKYYEQSLKIDPKALNVRTDMATAYYYAGDADRALSEFDVILKANPKHANALFNQGMIRWRAKMDINGATASWKKLLDTNPDYPRRPEVEQLLAQATKHATMKPGTVTDKPVGQ